jgi:hypothetical protein
MKMYENYLCEMNQETGSHPATSGRQPMTLTGGLLSATFILYRLKQMHDTMFSRDARTCSTIISPKDKNACMLKIKLKGISLEIKALSNQIRNCKDIKCKQKIVEKINDLKENFHEKTEQYNKAME